MAINLTLKTSPIILQYTAQGIPGKTGPMGLPGDDAISWEISAVMTGAPSGACTVKLYKDGKLCTEIHYAEIYTMAKNRTTYALSAGLCRTITGTYTFNYTNARSIFIIIWEDSSCKKVLCADSVSMIRGRDMRVLQCAALSFTSAQWVTYGAAGAVNTWTTGSSYDNTLLENGDQVLIIGTISDQLDGQDNPVKAMILGKASIPEGGSALESVSVISEGLFIGPAGAAATVTVGTVTTLAAGSSATVVNAGTPNNAVFNFGIPAGQPGSIANTLPFASITGEPSDNTKLAAALNGKAASSHNHSASNITSGEIPVASGGTGANNSADARANLNAASLYSNTFSNHQTIKDANVDYTASSNADTRYRYFRFQDNADNTYAYFLGKQNTDGSIVAQLTAKHSAVENILALKSYANGTRQVVVSDAGIWRTALGLTDMAIRPNYSISTTDLTAGTSALTTGQIYFVYE